MNGNERSGWRQAQRSQPPDSHDPQDLGYSHNQRLPQRVHDGPQRSGAQQFGHSQQPMADASRRTGPSHRQGATNDHGQGPTTRSLQDLGRQDRHADRPSTSPSLERYLREDNKDEALRRGEREGYARGAPGMASYLHDWQARWDVMDKSQGHKR